MCIAPAVQAQVSMHLREDTLHAAAGHTVSMQAVFYNHGTDTATYRLKLHETVFQPINAIPVRLVIPPGDSALIPVSLYIPRKAIAGKEYMIALHALPQDERTRVVLPDTAFISIAPVRQVYLQMMEPEVYVKAGQRNAEFSLQCNNVGNAGQLVQINISDPQQQLSTQTLAGFYIPGFTDTTLQITLPLPPALQQNPDSRLKITGQYADSTVFSTLLVRLYSVNSRKDYGMYDAPAGAGGPGHIIGVYSRFTGSQYHYMEGVAEGNFHFTPDRQLHYQADALYYTNTGSLFFLNTYLHYTAPFWGLQVGNLYRSYEIMLNGRGAALELTPANGQRLEAGYVNSRYNLAGTFKNEFYFRPYNAFYLNTSNRISGSITAGSQFIAMLDPQEQVNRYLGGGGISWKPAGPQQLEARAYISQSGTGTYVQDGITRRGAAGALSYNYSGNRWQLQSANYLSTKAYAGLQKGAVNLDEKLVFTPHSGLYYWLRYNQYAYTPERISPVYSAFGGAYKLRTAEAAVGWSAGELWQFMLRPYYYREQNRYDTAFGLQPAGISAGRLNADARYHTRNMHLFSLNLDGGIAQGSIAAYNRYFSFKLNAGYQYKHVSFNVLFQEGPYYSGELSIYAYTGNRYRLLMLSPAYTGYLFHKKLQLQAADYVIYDGSFRRWTNNLNLQAVYPLRGGITLEAGFTQIRYGFNQQLQSLDLGIRKTFAGKAAAGNNNALDLFFFLDNNGNYRLDEGEQPARNVLVRINKEILATDENGKIVYKHLPAGIVTIGIVHAGGYFTSDRSATVNGRTHLEIPLHRMNAIHGQVTLQRNSISYNTDENVANITIVAKDAAGKSFSARTNEQGAFTMYVPANTYAVTLDVGTLPQKYECADPVRRVVLTSRQPVDVKFRVQVQDRPVKIKKFYSLNKTGDE